MQYKILSKIKNIIGIGKFHDPKILINMDDKLPVDSALKKILLDAT